jgi:hypothetical protein
MAIKPDTVDKSIFFGVLDWTDKHKNSVDVINVFKKIQALPFEDGSRYFESTLGQRYAIILKDDPKNGYPIFGSIGDSRRTDLPFVEDVGTVSPLVMKKGAGLYDAMHFMIRKNQRGKWVITYEFNMYAPRVSAINNYVMNKFDDMVHYPIVVPVAGESVDRILRKFHLIKKIRMGIHPGVSVRDLSSGLEDAVNALRKENNGEHIDITIRAKRGNNPLVGRIVDNISRFFKTGNAPVAMDHFYISGINQEGEPYAENLMGIYLKEIRTVRKQRRDYRFIDSDNMYAALHDAYNVNAARLERL